MSNNRGFSLVEILVALAILALVVAVSVPLLTNSFEGVMWSGGKSKVTYGAQANLEENLFDKNSIDTGCVIVVFSNGRELKINDTEKVSVVVSETFLSKEITTVLDYYRTGSKYVEPVNDFGNYVSENNIFVFANNMTIEGSSTVVGPISTVVVKEGFKNSSNASINYIAAKEIFIQGSINMQNYALGVINGNVYVNGNVHIEGGSSDRPRILGNLFYTGNLTIVHYLGNSVIVGKHEKVAEIAFPTFNIPGFKQDTWYIDKNYSNNTAAYGGMKYYGNTYSFPTSGSYENVIIVSKGDINICGNVNVSGIMFAPNGTVTVDGSSTFTGIIISKEILVKGNSKVTFSNVEEFISNPEDYPFN